jgi:prepilin-type N-terminal cleavage/methylation domain-containing protein
MSRDILKRKEGVTFIELLLVLLISGILMAAFYRTFISQQKIYSVQEQVAEMQQNMLVAMGKMIREVRMAGYGGDILEAFGNINGFIDIITPSSNAITILLADEVGVLAQNALKGENQLRVTHAGTIFNTKKKRYLCLNGQNNYLIQSVSSNTIDLTTPLTEDHLANETVYLIKAITYNLGYSSGKTALLRNENTDGGSQPLAENIENLQFTYFDAYGNETVSPSNIRMIKVIVTTKTSLPDPQLKEGEGYRRKTLTCEIKVRNIGL